MPSLRQLGPQEATPRATPGAALAVAVLLWPSFPLMSLAGVVESLRHAGDHGDQSQPRYARWDILGPPGTMIRSSCGLAVPATAAHGDPGGYDQVVVIGGLLPDLGRALPGHRPWLRAAHRAGVPVMGVCTGSFVLAAEGLLEGHVAAIHPYHQRDFQTAFPHLRHTVRREFMQAGGIATVLGGVSILPVMRRLIGAHLGTDRAAKVAYQMTQPAPDRPAPADPLPEIGDPRIQRALVMLDAEATQPPQVAALAQTLGLSERHFLRLFRAEMGCTPRDYLVQTRLRAAVWMLRNTGRSVTEIAYAVGFASGGTLADHCRKRLGMTPLALRRAARSRSGAGPPGAPDQERPDPDVPGSPGPMSAGATDTDLTTA